MSDNIPADDKAARERAEFLRKYKEKQAGKAAGSRAQQFRSAAWESTKKQIPGLNALVNFSHAVGWIPKYLIWKPAKWVAEHGTTYKGEDKKRHWSLIRSAFTAAALTVTTVAAPHFLPFAYYHATEREFQIYVASDAMFQNQQFNKANESGHVIAPRDEIFTVLAHRVENGRIEQAVRFEIDANPYMGLFRPDLLAAQIDSASQYGATCTVEGTGIYTVVPRMFRYAPFIRVLNLRNEITDLKEDPGLSIAGFQAHKVQGEKCHQVTQEEYKFLFNQMDAPPKATSGAEKAPVTSPPPGWAPITAAPVKPEQKLLPASTATSPEQGAGVLSRGTTLQPDPAPAIPASASGTPATPATPTTAPQL